MASSLIQFRYEESNMQKASAICEQLGMDLATYMRMALDRLIQENGIPFSIKQKQAPESKGLKAMKAASCIAKENGISEMSLDEINYEISQARNKEDTMSEKSTSKFISLILRHHPEVIGITLDEHGWADVDELIEGVGRTRKIDRELLEKIVAEDEKQRYSFNEDKTLIRANQGHSVPVDVELEKKTPPAMLWHGTGEKYVESIEEQGLLPKARLYVHLSADYETAVKVGSRHGHPVVFEVASGAMQEDGYDFFQSVNGVWLTKHVPVKYLNRKIRREERGNVNMSETKLKRPRFLTEEMENDPFYHSVPDPTKNPPPCHYNLLELSRYSTRTGKAIVDMTKEELDQFSTLKSE